MKRIAMIVNGIVANIAVWDGVSAWEPEGFELVDITEIPLPISLDWLFDAATQTFSPPQPEG